MLKRLAFLPTLAVALLVAWPALAADGGVAKHKRAVYPVKYGSAKELAAALTKYFRGELEVQALPESQGNFLLLSGPSAVLDETLILLGRLDRRPQVIAVEVLVAEVTPKKGDGDKEELDERGFSGPAREVLARLQGLQKTGQVGELKRFQLTTTEGRAATVLAGASVPMVTGVNAFGGRGGGGGTVTRMISYRNVGTEVHLTPWVNPDRKITLDLRLSDSGLRTSPDGVVLGKDDNGAPILAAVTTTSRLETKLSLASGQAALAKGVESVSKSGKAKTLVIVTARVVEPGGKLEK